MSKNRSLDEFIASSETEPESTTDLDITYRFDDAGGRCARCGESVQSRWDDEAGWICSSCNAWNG